LNIFSPATGSPTTTLLRLRPDRRPHYQKLTIRYKTRIRQSFFKQSCLSGRDGRCVQSSITYSPRRYDTRLLAITPSCHQVSGNNPNLAAR